ncbi:MAG: cob(I)yrinic acid a,c-diamide adenosyltransferase [Acetatifactor sp.]|nr:cob(I)yrinic acid a,c-diamide adenosyltransferase [Acetatifactor sp.]
MIHLYTGDGKGKTTAAIGLCVRALGRGKRVVFAQFMKSSDTGELNVLKELKNVRIMRSDKQFGFYNTLTDEEKKELKDIHNRILDEAFEDVTGGVCDLLVLDEVTYPLNWELLDRKRLEKIIVFAKEEPQKLELVMTGRNPDKMLEDSADYLTRMECVKHPYEKGVSAREGIEY